MDDIIERMDEIEQEASDRLLASNGSLDVVYPEGTYYAPFTGSAVILRVRPK